MVTFNCFICKPPESRSEKFPLFLLGGFDISVLSKYAYLYQYDSLNRMIGKKLPGAGWTYYAYDAADQLVATQDAELRKQGKWLFTLNDVLKREVLKGTCTQIAGITCSQTAFNDMVLSAKFSTTDGMYKGYTVLKDGQMTVQNSAEILLVNYYDNYDFLNLSELANMSLAYDNTQEANGYGVSYHTTDSRTLLTGTYVAQLGENQGNALYSALYYDNRKQLVQIQETNHLTDGREKEYFAYNFIGEIIRRYHVHSTAGKADLTEEYTYEYDNWGRVLTIKHKLNDNAWVTLAANSYDALGRLENKTFHNNDVNKVNYTYNIRSWLTGISNINSFTQTMDYNNHYNGNISKLNWTAGESNHTYTLSYDGLNRLTDAVHGNNHYTEKVTSYDKNGNIKRLHRYGLLSDGTYGVVDDLTFTLNGNQLAQAEDASPATIYNGGTNFLNGANSINEFEYDDNGNLIKDLNKNITDISYNCLNLPQVITYADGSMILYTYTADGRKLNTVYKSGTVTHRMDYCGNILYEEGNLKMLLTDEGYVTPTDNAYHYYMKDYLGNVRAVVQSDGSIDETNDYYPFGGSFAKGLDVQPFKYNGKEYYDKAGLNWYDYGARHYDAALGRWHVLDLLSESAYPKTPYGYCINNPIHYIDIMGLEPIDIDQMTIDKWKNFKTNEDEIVLNEVIVTPETYSNGSASLGPNVFSTTMTFLGIGGSTASTIGGLRYTDRGWGSGYFTTQKGKTHPFTILNKQPNGKYVRGVQGYRYSAEWAKNSSKLARTLGNNIGFMNTFYGIGCVIGEPNFENIIDLSIGFASLVYWEIGAIYTFGKTYSDWVIMPNIQQIRMNIENGVSPMRNVYNPQTGMYNY